MLDINTSASQTELEALSRFGMSLLLHNRPHVWRRWLRFVLLRVESDTMRFLIACLAGIALVACNARNASAETVFSSSQTHCGFTTTQNSPQIDPFTLSFTDLPTTALGDATLTITVFGDFDLSSEWISVTADGDFEFGRFLDNDTTNDLFDSPDVGNQYFDFITATATISHDVLSAMIADGQVDFAFAFGSMVENLFDVPQIGLEEFVTLDFVFETAETPVIPEPSSLVLFGIGACGLWGYSLRRKKLAATVKA